MNEFEAGTKRQKISEHNEKTMYDNTHATEKAKEKAMKKPIGGNFNKRDQKGRNKAKNDMMNEMTEEEKKSEKKLKELKVYYNQLRVKIGDLKPNREQKNEIIEHCFEIIADNYKDIIFKHDGCRVLQCMLKHGTDSHRTKIILSLLEHFADLLPQKYSHHLAKKMVEYSPTEELKKKMLSKIINRIGRFIMHTFAAEVIEVLYSSFKQEQKKEMLSAFYGEFFLILQENKGTSIQDLVEQKPIIKEGLVGKLESITHKLIDKGMTRHTIVQAILYDYLSIANNEDRLELVNLLSEVFPALLSSDKGLKAACGLWAVASSKDRRTIIKVVKPLVLEMAVNPISSLFLLYICMTLDDTVQCKKSIVNNLVKHYEDFSDKAPAVILYSCLLTGINMPIRNVIHKDWLEAIKFLDSEASNKKEEQVRRKEILGNLVQEV